MSLRLERYCRRMPTATGLRLWLKRLQVIDSSLLQFKFCVNVGDVHQVVYDLSHKTD